MSNADYTGVLLFIYSISMLLSIVWVTLDSVTRQKRMPGVEKVIWITVAFLLGPIGAAVYYFVIKREHRYEREPEAF
ncbi:hypothetical protein CL1_1298 [Thermococcus cleftensis]|uniref:Uncharacterized protein n=1 Tax=Thermococcus cleftensis (strain DSM 27260 / KACC 17922 / CL1) TaxID=163003 RepID=I3ZUW3_THECF|nr:PLDc N-terminal domain-containing protein [Thermococcus cleftensis]AFL95497.1 hypothetical protein CL1_1298 [Thermococcus cleftensis]